MKIVLVIEKSRSESAVEKTFAQPVIRIGRDPQSTDISFDPQDFRMVSRHHADIRFKSEKWMVGDMGSSFGTFLNGQRLEKPTEIKVGSSIQFGETGPRAHVIWLEGGSAVGESDQRTPAQNETPDLSAPPPEPVPVAEPAPQPGSSFQPEKAPEAPPKKVQQPVSRPRLKLSGGKGEVQITTDSFWLGRDPNCDVVIESDAVMVSRKHARILREGDRWFLSDNQRRKDRAKRPRRSRS